MNLPLMLTLGRLLLTPVFLGVYLYFESLGISLIALPFILLGMLVFSELSDVFDGIIARRWNQVTDLGKLLDPMADSIFKLSIFIAMTQGIVQLPVLVVLIFFIRESLIGTLRTVCALKGVALAARVSGKVKTIIQGVVLFLIVMQMIPYSFGLISLKTFQMICGYSVSIAAVFSVISGVEYLIANWSFIKKTLVPLKNG